VSIRLIAPKTGRTKALAEASPRVLLYTDESAVERVPPGVRRAADLYSTEDLGVWRGEPWKGQANGALVWLAGEQLLRGGSEELRAVFFAPQPVDTLVAVHHPGLPEADLLAVQPRLLRAGARGERLSRAVRVAAAASPSAAARQAWKECRQPWAALQLALLAEGGPEGLTGALKELWTRRLPPLLASLVLRNLIVALLAQHKWEKASELLTLGRRAYPGYAELEYLSAVLWLRRGKPSQAVPHLERALRGQSGGWVGSGGECSYRSAWVLGTICEQVGEQDRALAQYLPGVYERPAFAPSVGALLRQRLSRFRAEQLQQPLCELVRREPAYLEAVFEFFLQHSALGPPRRLLRTLPLPPERSQALHARLADQERRLHPAPRQEGEKPGVALEGPFLTLSGHARINRALGGALLDAAALEVILEPSESSSAASRALPESHKMARGLRRQTARLDLTIRHQWPPDFRPPEAGRLACILPWEHRAVPRAWVREIARTVDELWVPSRFVAQAFTGAGVEGQRVQVIPNGFDPQVFHPGVPAARPPECRGCLFLFVGGTILRKGADLLLQAFADAFSGDDDATLLFKDTGGSSFYRHNTLLPEIQRAAARPGAPHILVQTEQLDDAALAALYRGCDALVLPYRGEGFGMPLLEAMACGRPVVTTAAGPALEFCPAEGCYLLPAVEVPVTEPPPPLGEFSGPWTWFEPDLLVLAETLRAIYERREEAARRGRLAAERVAQTHGWPRAARGYLARIAALTAPGGTRPAPAEEAAELAGASPR
jgi:glycosyltransferase involved in cell wall biosynthesis